MSNTIGFDESFYLSQNPDVAAAVSRGIFTSGAQHFQLNGRFEGRNPNAFFNTSFYLGQYPDVAKAGINPLTHFLTSGAAEGRFANATEKAAIDLNGNGGADDFNEAAYRAQYSDVDAAIKAGTFKNAYQHFVQFGQFEARVATLANGTTVTGPFGNTGAGGSNLALTTGVDTIVGTNGNDIITADNTGSSPTLSAADTINGGAGNDTLRVFLSDTATGLPAAAISNIETMLINGGKITAFDATKFTGLTAVTFDSTVQADATTNVITTSGQTVTLANQSLTTANGGNFTTQITSATDTAANVVLSNVASKAGTTSGTSTQTLDIAASKIATVNLTSTGSANTVTLTNSATSAPVTAITIAGDKALTLNESLVNVKTINASTATGNITVNTAGATANAALNFTGGAGNDKIVFAASAITSTTVLDGGAGTDTIAINDVSLTTANAGINAAKNFEILSFVGGTTTQGISADLSKVTSVSQFSIDAATTGAATTAGVSFSGESNAQAVILNANVTGGTVTSATGTNGLVLTPATDTGSNIATLTLNGVTVKGGAGDGNNNAGGAAVNFASFETVNINSNFNAAGTTGNTFTGGAGAGNGAAGAGLTVGANATVNIAGAGDINLGSVVSNAGATTNNNLTLNAANLTGKLTVTTGAGNDVITGGSNVNAITLGGGADSVDITRSTTKADTVVVSSATGVLKTGIVVTGFTNAATTGDKIDLIDTATIATATTGAVASGSGATAVSASINSQGLVTFSAVGASATLSDYVDASFKAINANTGHASAVFQLGGDSYIVQENGGNAAGTFDAGTDVVVKLTGVTGLAGLSTTASDSTHVFIA